MVRHRTSRYESGVPAAGTSPAAPRHSHLEVPAWACGSAVRRKEGRTGQHRVRSAGGHGYVPGPGQQLMSCSVGDLVRLPSALARGRNLSICFQASQVPPVPFPQTFCCKWPGVASVSSRNLVHGQELREWCCWDFRGLTNNSPFVLLWS